MEFSQDVLRKIKDSENLSQVRATLFDPYQTWGTDHVNQVSQWCVNSDVNLPTMDNVAQLWSTSLQNTARQGIQETSDLTKTSDLEHNIRPWTMISCEAERNMPNSRGTSDLERSMQHAPPGFEPTKYPVKNIGRFETKPRPINPPPGFEPKQAKVPLFAETDMTNDLFEDYAEYRFKRILDMSGQTNYSYSLWPNNNETINEPPKTMIDHIKVNSKNDQPLLFSQQQIVNLCPTYCDILKSSTILSNEGVPGLPNLDDSFEPPTMWGQPSDASHQMNSPQRKEKRTSGAVSQTKIDKSEILLNGLRTRKRKSKKNPVKSQPTLTESTEEPPPPPSTLQLCFQRQKILLAVQWGYLDATIFEQPLASNTINLIPLVLDNMRKIRAMENANNGSWIMQFLIANRKQEIASLKSKIAAYQDEYLKKCSCWDQIISFRKGSRLDSEHVNNSFGVESNFTESLQKSFADICFGQQRSDSTTSSEANNEADELNFRDAAVWPPIPIKENNSVANPSGETSSIMSLLSLPSQFHQ